MTELNLGLSPNKADSRGNDTDRPTGHKRKIMIAALLSLLVPGLGQVYIKRPWRGLALALVLTLLVFLAGELHLLLTFVALLGFLFVSILLRLYIGTEAGYLATKEKQASSTGLGASNTVRAAIAVVVLALGAYPVPDYLIARFSYFHAFKVTSASMCPTICEGDRIVANMGAFAKSEPRRGDVIMMKFGPTDTLFIKRVIGVEGDVIAPKGRNILVNGEPLVLAAHSGTCGKGDAASSTGSESASFAPTKVLPSSFFVIGDNLANSYDSRFFGLLSYNQVRGRPLYIYWSRTTSRIGCPIR